MTYESDDTRPRVARLMEPKLHVDAENADDPETALITSYLLGELTVRERGALRERMRRDPEFRENVMIMTCLLPGADALEDLNACGERFDSPGDIMLELDRRRAVRVARRHAARRRVRLLRAASIAGIAVLPSAGIVTARVASLRHAGDPPQAVASSIPRGDGSRVASRPAATAKPAGVASPAAAATGATPTRGSGPKTSSRPKDPTAIPPVRGALHDSPRLLASVKPATPLLNHPVLNHPAGPVACSAPSRMAARAHELAQAAADSAARDSALQGTRPSPLRELLNGAAAQGARGSTAAGMHPAPPLGVRPARPVIPPAGGGAVPPKAADSTTKAPAVSGNACDGGAPGNPKTGEPRRKP